MKKLFYYFFSALIAVSFSATMLSCGDNDDDVKPTSQQPKDDGSGKEDHSGHEGEDGEGEDSPYHVNLTCSTCTGSGACPTCKGSGKGCKTCGGTGKYCNKCKGSGSCNGCNGSKKCTYCNGTGTQNCYKCDGNGRCFLCGGIDFKHVPGTGNVNCSLCNGSGKCGDCNGSGGRTFTDCYISGSGQCYFCKGEGKCSECNGTPTCKSCNGTGDCTSCKNSDGKCAACNGNGYITVEAIVIDPINGLCEYDQSKVAVTQYNNVSSNWNVPDNKYYCFTPLTAANNISVTYRSGEIKENMRYKLQVTFAPETSDNSYTLLSKIKVTAISDGNSTYPFGANALELSPQETTTFIADDFSVANSEVSIKFDTQVSSREVGKTHCRIMRIAQVLLIIDK